jgi:glycosyltransferase involved in cell wall biosynthesis
MGHGAVVQTYAGPRGSSLTMAWDERPRAAAQAPGPVDVLMLGARMHYAVPLALARARLLGHFFTDLYCGNKPWLRWLLACLQPVLPEPLRRLRQRDAGAGLPAARVLSFDRFGWQLWRALRVTSSPAARSALYAWAGAQFCRMVIARNPTASQVYALNGAALEMFQFARARGAVCILEQASQPGRLVQATRRAELARWPGLEAATPSLEALDPVASREEAEWCLSDLIVCGSQFVADTLTAAGVAPQKCRVVPYGVDLTRFGATIAPPCGPHPGLNLLFVGAVSLLKGAHYLLQALALLNSAHIRCRLVGEIQLSQSYLRRFSRWAEFVGPVPREEVLRHYRWAQVFVLPSLCEGSALVTYEAMACGLPVITTPNAGSVVRHGIDGLVVPAQDASALAAAIDRLSADPAWRESLAASATAHVRAYDLDAYGQEIVKVLTAVSRAPSAPGRLPPVADR